MRIAHIHYMLAIKLETFVKDPLTQFSGFFMVRGCRWSGELTKPRVSSRSSTNTIVNCSTRFTGCPRWALQIFPNMACLLSCSFLFEISRNTVDTDLLLFSDPYILHYYYYPLHLPLRSTHNAKQVGYLFLLLPL